MSFNLENSNMRENEILDAIDAITLNKFSDEEKSIILAHILHEQKNTRVAKSLNRLVLEKIAEHSKGVTEYLSDYAQDFDNKEAYPKPFEVLNKDEIDKFLDKMTSEKYDGDFFNDTFEFYHPVANMRAEGVPRHRSDFNINQ